jgi:hypothetical protein
MIWGTNVGAPTGRKRCDSRLCYEGVGLLGGVNRPRIKMFARMGLYVMAACFAYIAIWLAWMISGPADTVRGSVHVFSALGVAMAIGTPAGFAMAMALTPSKIKRQ